VRQGDKKVKILFYFYFKASKYNRVIRKVRKTQHQNPEFGHTKSEIQKKTPKKYTNIQRGMKLRKASILVVN
jgi:hypothetical protein